MPKSEVPDLGGEFEEIGKPATEPLFSVEQVLLQLKEAEQEKDAAKRLVMVGDALDQMTDADREKLLGTPAVQRLVEQAREKVARDGRPGTTVCDSKGRVLERVEHTRTSMVEEFGMVKWTPMESRWCTVNGVSAYFVKGIECESPPQFRDVMMEAYQAQAQFDATAAKIMERNFGKDSMIITGAGDLVWSGRESR